MGSCSKDHMDSSSEDLIVTKFMVKMGFFLSDYRFEK
jgi:hypothetical protein